MTKELTGQKVFMIVFAFFGVVIAVNVYMASRAIGTFPGLEVENSYVASQQFNDKARAQEALGWTLKANNEGGKLHISISGPDGIPVQPNWLHVRVGRPTIARDDQIVEMEFDGTKFIGQTDLAGGKWYAYVDATSVDGVALTQRLEFFVNE